MATRTKDHEWFDKPLADDANILQRMAWVTANCGTLVRDASVDVGRGAQFRALSHDALVEALNPLLARAGIYGQPKVVSSEEDQIEVRSIGRDGREYTRTANRARVAVGYRFWRIDAEPSTMTVNGDSGNAESVGYLEGRDYVDLPPLMVTAYDTSDKAAGKAVSYAKKYQLRLAFSVATGEDVDSGQQLEYAGEPTKRSAPPKREATQYQQQGTLDDQRPEPTLASEPHDLAMEIPESAWHKVASAWDRHQNGVTQPQLRLLFGRAGAAHGWASDEIKNVVQHHLGVELTEVPNRGAFDELLAIFTTYAKDEAGADFDEAFA